MKVTMPTDIEKKVLDLLTDTFSGAAKQFAVLANNEASKIETAMKSHVPVKEGALLASIGISKSKKNNYFFWVGPQYSNKSSLFKGGNHAHLVEYGSKERYMKKGLLAGGFTRESGGANKFKGPHKYMPYAGKSTGMMPQKPFIRPTYDQMGDTVIANLKNETEKIVLAEANKKGI